ncbi:YlaI family protein [Massilibacterium senegalense]|uniref:YlaI family protein n=1 Tax=Massilibacterium senegalense TaxID=1632858 RepID=UPI0007844E21|nr:YlaI family protein [Massilibacterium senegalense]
MRVKCVLCDKIENIDSESSVAKKLRNRPVHTYMCQECTDRIAKKTIAHHESGNFKLYTPKKQPSDWW